jgi:hypothetical protein
MDYFGIYRIFISHTLAIQAFMGCIYKTDFWNFFRSCDVPMRKRYVRLVESVKEGGGDVKIFSSLHVSGERKGNIFELILHTCFQFDSRKT